MASAIEALSRFIREELGYEGDLDPDIDLLEERILDSFNVVEVATFIQEQLNVDLQAEDVVRENFARLSDMAALVDRRTAAVDNRIGLGASGDRRKPPTA